MKKELFKVVKAAFFAGAEWPNTGWSGQDIKAMSKVLGECSPYLICAYDKFFANHVALGPSVITCINDEAVRLRAINGSNWDWVELKKFKTRLKPV